MYTSWKDQCTIVCRLGKCTMQCYRFLAVVVVVHDDDHDGGGGGDDENGGEGILSFRRLVFSQEWR